ncbi:MAG: glycosyltransferase family 39 protein [Candidatus Pacebacteria bacterium]|nr:glycosyltransferase family 39 protein [Candidatus Paceibacterota bacterium]
MKKINTKILLIIIILLTFFTRMYRINNPIADWHSWRQSDTASVTREYVKHGVDILRPHYQDISDLQSGQDNLEGWRMVEFPFINAGIAALIRFMPNLNLDVTSRMVSVWFSIGAAISLFYLVKSISGKDVAFYSSLVFALLPFSVFYGRAVLPEPAMLFFSTGSLLFFQIYLQNKNKLKQLGSYLISLIFLMLALLLKPFVAFLGPIYLVLALLRYKKNIFKHVELIIFAGAAFVPFYYWREWIKQFPSGIPASDWLFNSNGIRLRPAWFRWLFYERLTRLILGWWGWLFIISNLHGLGFNSKTKKKWIKETLPEILIYGSWIVGILIYMIVIATGNVRHDYYQVLALPIVSILVGRGVALMIPHLSKILNKKAAYLITFIIFSLMLKTAWNNVKGYFNVNHWEYIEAGMIIDTITPPDAKIIAPAFGDTVFLYQTNRRGWPIGFDIESKVAKGATYYVSSSYDDEARAVEEKYTPVIKSDKFIIIKLEERVEEK